MATQTIRVVGQNNAPRTVVTSLTRQEAMKIVKGLKASFAKSLARQYEERGSLSTRQWNWVLVLAQESLPATPPVAYNPPAAVPSPAKKEEAPKAIPAPIVPDRDCSQVGQLTMLQYDIHNKSFDLPYRLFRQRAFWITESVICIREDNLPWSVLNAMTEAHVTWHAVPFATSATEQLVALAEASLKAKIEAATKSMAESIEKAGIQMDNAEATATEKGTEFDQQKAASYCQSRCKAAIKTCEQTLEDLAEASKAFGLINATANGIATTRNQANALRGIYRAKVAAYLGLAQQAEGTQMEVAAKSSEMPAGILCDYLEDQGKDVSTARELFQPTPVVTAQGPALTISTENLSWTGATKTFSCEASEVGYNRAAREVVLKSHKTGTEKVFKLSFTDKDGEGWEMGWRFECDGIQLLIIND